MKLGNVMLPGFPVDIFSKNDACCQAFGSVLRWMVIVCRQAGAIIYGNFDARAAFLAYCGKLYARI
jgi:hypothetical protein